jgi:hypothetical protein
MNRNKQLGFEILEAKNMKFFGGSHLKNSNPKTARPISTKRSMHLVMHSSKAKGSYSFLKFYSEIQLIINTQAKAFGVKVYRQANAGNHLHLIVLPRSREAFNGFIRAISGLIPRLVLGVERGSGRSVLTKNKLISKSLENSRAMSSQHYRAISPQNSKIRSKDEIEVKFKDEAKSNSNSNSITKVSHVSFWNKRPFTRIVEWGREFKSVSRYLLQNTLEAFGFIPYQPRKARFKPNESTA